MLRFVWLEFGSFVTENKRKAHWKRLRKATGILKAISIGLTCSNVISVCFWICCHFFPFDLFFFILRTFFIWYLRSGYILNACVCMSGSSRLIWFSLSICDTFLQSFFFPLSFFVWLLPVFRSSNTCATELLTIIRTTTTTLNSSSSITVMLHKYGTKIPNIVWDLSNESGLSSWFHCDSMFR